MARPYSWENTVRRHDEAFSLWLRGLRLDYGNLGGSPRARHPILQTFAAPQRAFAELATTLIKQGFLDGASIDEKMDRASLFSVLPLPFATIERGEPVPDPSQAGSVKRFRKKTCDPATGKIIAHPWPAMYTTEYRVTFWTLTRATEVFIREWVYAQLGKIGTSENEVFLNIPHEDPWGTIQQALKFESSSDLSDLEGDSDQRSFRFEFTFTLNTVFFRLPYDVDADGNMIGELGVDYVDNVDAQAEFRFRTDDVLPHDPNFLQLLPAIETGNLYRPYVTQSQILRSWPVAGAAVVEASAVAPEGVSKETALMVTTEASGDVASLANVLFYRSLSFGVILVQFDLLTDGDVFLDIYQHDGTHAPGAAPAYESLRQERLLENLSWRRRSFLTVVTSEVVDVSLRGADSGTAFSWVSRPVIRRLIPGDVLDPSTGPDTVGLNDEYVWAGLTSRPFLLVIPFTLPDAGSVVVEDDSLSPSLSETIAVDGSVQKGLAYVVTPLAASIRLRVPTALAIAPPKLQRYDGTHGERDL